MPGGGARHESAALKGRWSAYIQRAPARREAAGRAERALNGGPEGDFA